MKRCRACDSTYNDIDAEGFRFFHACPYLSPFELLQLVPGLDEKTAQALTGVQRDGHRDENFKVDDDGRLTIVAEGLGVDDVPDVDVIASARTVSDVVALVKARNAIIAVGPSL